MVSNGIHKRVLKPGVWAPSPAFMDEQEELGEYRGSSPRYVVFPVLLAFWSVYALSMDYYSPRYP